MKSYEKYLQDLKQWLHDTAKVTAIFLPPTTYKTAKGKNDGDLLKFVKISFRTPSTDSLRTCQTGEGISFYPSLYGIILAIFENAKNGRKKTGNLFLISCLGVPFYVMAVIQFTVCCLLQL